MHVCVFGDNCTKVNPLFALGQLCTVYLCSINMEIIVINISFGLNVNM